MAKRIRLTGTVEQKLKMAEILFNRVIGNRSKKKRGIIPPILISYYTVEPDENGLIYKHFIIARGKISKVGIAVGNTPKPQEEYAFICKLERNSTLVERVITIKDRYAILDIDIPVEPGDIISLYSAISVDGRSIDMGGVSISILYHLGIKDSVVKSYLVDDLLIEMEGIINASETDSSGCGVEMESD